MVYIQLCQSPTPFPVAKRGYDATAPREKDLRVTCLEFIVFGIGLPKAVVGISLGCRQKPTGFHKKANRLLHKVVKYLLMNRTVPVFAIA